MERVILFRDSFQNWKSKEIPKAQLILTDIPFKLRLGYTKKYMEALVNKIEIVNGKDTDLHIDKPVYAIHLADVREV